MKDLIKKFVWILFEISWPLGLGMLLFYGGLLSCWIFKDPWVFMCVWISVQALSMITPFVLSVFDKIRFLSTLVGGLWGGGVYAWILYRFIMLEKEALSPLTKSQILKEILHFGGSREDYLKLGCVFWSLSAMGASFYVIKYALTSFKGRKTFLKNKPMHQKERSTHGSATLIGRKELGILNQKQGIPIGVYQSKILEIREPLQLKEKLKTLKLSLAQ
ncbi:MAG: hypothetical protein B7Y25_07365 [Alphaproteobacteria bacterium 16-39-46]|nr:MAG: hypothetical protein B7Y25_07365 [Alphaproteobacteria bacterium 16-39-46]OZA41700.1 MAG: hypothetical protein B7X84_07595 [Alphaproteobacteria bacterium 17-39-52]HQS84741.1 hypothetical protein [Alphaproteobacteria bacterium]HQS94553.1 hypothetical protein [Alphaproteobacteria bacterium]